MKSVIQKVAVTEKAYAHKHAIVFKVDNSATKTSIARELKQLYGKDIKIKSVRISRLPQKTSGSLSRSKVKRKDQKRAYVYIDNKVNFDFVNFKK